LDSCLGRALSGVPVVLLIEGEAGIGKSRLIRRLVQCAQGTGFQAGIGRSQQDLAVPYLPVATALRSVLGSDSQAKGAPLGASFPFSALDAAPALSAIGAGHPDRDHQDRLRLFLSVSRLVLALARRQPTLLVLEDLHWADRASLELLAALVAHLSDVALVERVPFVIAATHRPVSEPSALLAPLARLRREDTCTSIQLTGLCEDDAKHLVEELGLERPSHQLVRLVHGTTQGNPLFIQTVVEQLRREHLLHERAGYLVADIDANDLRLPTDLADAIESRIGTLTTECRSVLTAAAVLGGEFEIDDLRALTAKDVAEIRQLLQEAGTLVVAGSSRCHFSHALIRELVHRTAPIGERQELHARAAEALSKTPRANVASVQIEIATHILAAGSRVTALQVLQSARGAAEAALTLFAWADAASFFSVAAAAADASALLGVDERAHLHFLAGLCHRHDWDWGPCFEELKKALDGYRSAANASGMAEVLILHTLSAQTLTAYGDLMGTTDQEEVLAQLGDSEPVLRGRLLEALAEAHWMAQRPKQAEQYAARALALAQVADNDALAQYACFAGGLALFQQSRAREAVVSFRQALAHARYQRDVWLQNQPLQRITMTLHLLGQLDEAKALGAGAHELARQTNDVGEASFASGNLACLAAARGDWAAVEQHARDAVSAGQRSLYPWGAVFALTALAGSRWQRGQLSEAADAVQLLLEPGRFFRQVGPFVQGMAFVHLELIAAAAAPGSDVRAKLIEDLGALANAAGQDAGALSALCSLVELAALEGVPGPVEPIYRVLLHALEHGAVLTNGWVFAVARVAGVAAMLLGRHDEAERHFEQALVLTRRLEAGPEYARTCVDYARLISRRSPPADADVERARSLLREARATASRLDLRPLEYEISVLAATLGGEAELAVRAPALSSDVLTSHEVRLLQKVARGDSDLQIARELLVHEKTLSHDLDLLLNKIGAAGRMGAAAYVLDKGLLDHDRPRFGVPLVILVTDLEGFTPLVQRLGDGRAQQLIRAHNHLLRTCLQRHGGTEITHTGDGLMASFRSASRAVMCSAEMQQQLRSYSERHVETPLHVRVGLHAGEPLPEEDRLFGTCINTAVRVCATANAGEVLVTDVVRHLAAGQILPFVDRGVVALKGLSTPMRLHELRWVDHSSIAAN
jgi:class 3 adenylate cyclase